MKFSDMFANSELYIAAEEIGPRCFISLSLCNLGASDA